MICALPAYIAGANGIYKQMEMAYSHLLKEYSGVLMSIALC